MESDVDWEFSMQVAETHALPLAWTLPVHLAGHVLTAILDSRSSISMLRSSLLLQLPVLQVASVACFHRYVEQCPVVTVPLHYLGQRHEVAVAKVQRLPYAVVFGQDALGFTEAVQQFPVTGVQTARTGVVLVSGPLHWAVPDDPGDMRLPWDEPGAVTTCPGPVR